MMTSESLLKRLNDDLEYITTNKEKSQEQYDKITFQSSFEDVRYASANLHYWIGKEEATKKVIELLKENLLVLEKNLNVKADNNSN